jgi:hypothetical protein
MGNYTKKPISGNRIEKVRVTEHIIEKTNTTNTTNATDIDALAAALSKMININISGNVANISQSKKDDFDESSTMEKLAQSMIIQRNKNENNFDNDLGNIEKTKANQAETDKKIDLLSNLED